MSLKPWFAWITPFLVVVLLRQPLKKIICTILEIVDCLIYMSFDDYIHCHIHKIGEIALHDLIFISKDFLRPWTESYQILYTYDWRKTMCSVATYAWSVSDQVALKLNDIWLLGKYWDFVQLYSIYESLCFIHARCRLFFCHKLGTSY